jgi:hypothetical protein
LQAQINWWITAKMHGFPSSHAFRPSSSFISTHLSPVFQPCLYRWPQTTGSVESPHRKLQLRPSKSPHRQPCYFRSFRLLVCRIQEIWLSSRLWWRLLSFPLHCLGATGGLSPQRKCCSGRQFREKEWKRVSLRHF